jgi:hypothetical protein
MTSNSKLNELRLPVVLLDNFDSQPEAQDNEAYRTSPAAYRISGGKILVNANTFLPLEERAAIATIVHEIGHAVADRDHLMARRPYSTVSDCTVADYLGSCWGFHDELLVGRKRYGKKYLESLGLWQNEGEYFDAMSLWYSQWLAGLIQPA